MDGPKGLVGHKGYTLFSEIRTFKKNITCKICSIFEGSKGSNGPKGKKGDVGKPGIPGRKSVSLNLLRSLYTHSLYAIDPFSNNLNENLNRSMKQRSLDTRFDPYLHAMARREKLMILESLIQRMIYPNGEKWFPARTCHDLFLDYPKKESGFYFINPVSSMMSGESIEIYCDRESTCFDSEREELDFKENHHQEEIKFKFKHERSMKKVAKLSSGAIQLISIRSSEPINCSTIQFESNTKAYKFLASSDQYPTYELIQESNNECTFKFRASLVDLLPIRSIQMENNHQFVTSFRMRFKKLCFY